jgi:hypothetical protein
VTPSFKAGVVAGGVVAAFLIALAVVALRVALTSGPAGQASSGMFAFGDALLFVGVFGAAALVPVAAGLFWLRPVRWFWMVLAGLSLGVTATSLVAAVVFAAGTGTSTSPMAAWDGLALLRILAAPFLAFGFLVCAVISPHRSPRFLLLASTLVEAAVTLYAASVWLIRG